MATPAAQTKFLWIDAICIDQDDNKDKASQLPLMSKIYRDSAAVLMWIGTEPALSREAFEIISLLSRTAGELKGLEDLGFTITGDMVLGNGLRLDTLVSNRAWPDVLDILAFRSYFTRLWIMQEVLLANEETAQVLSGSFSCSWTDFQRAARLVNCCTPLRESIVGDEKSVIDTVENLRYMKVILRRAISEEAAIGEIPGQPGGRRDGDRSDTMLSPEANSDIPASKKARSSIGFPLMACVDHTEIQQRHVFERRDRVFALLGMLNEFTRELFIPPDYNMPPEAIFERATFVMVLESQLLNHFIWMDNVCERPQKPSWVGFSDFEPQLYFPCPLHNITAEINYPITFEFEDRAVHHHDLFRFIEGYTPLRLDELFGTSHPHPVLIAGGFVFDQVKTVSQSFCEGNLQSEILGVYRELKVQHPRTGNGPQGLLQTIWSPLDPFNNPEDKARTQSSFFALFSRWVLKEFGVTHEVIKANKVLRSSGEQYYLIAKLFSPTSDPSSSTYSKEDLRLFLSLSELGVDKLAMDILRTFHISKESGVLAGRYGRNLFSSSKAYMGIGPMGDNGPKTSPAVQVGDQIVVLARLGLPVILRPLRDGTHSLIGPAYIPGIEDNPLLESGSMPPLQDIRIR